MTNREKMFKKESAFSRFMRGPGPVVVLGLVAVAIVVGAILGRQGDEELTRRRYDKFVEKIGEQHASDDGSTTLIPCFPEGVYRAEDVSAGWEIPETCLSIIGVSSLHGQEVEAFIPEMTTSFYLRLPEGEHGKLRISTELLSGGESVASGYSDLRELTKDSTYTVSNQIVLPTPVTTDFIVVCVESLKLEGIFLDGQASVSTAEQLVCGQSLFTLRTKADTP